MKTITITLFLFAFVAFTPRSARAEDQCGNGQLDTGEQCDDGEDNSDLEPDACRGDCRLPYCDDGVTDSDEECDDGSRNADNQPDVCRDDCTLPYCGDGIVDVGHGEECDEGAGNSGDPDATCSLSCIIPGCGNGTLEAWEVCDDGNASDTDACTGQCRYNVCGDGALWSGMEYCEYDQPWDPGDCRYDCGEDASMCGNGTVDPGEGCDDGIDRNSDEPDAVCRTDCQPRRCGDGIVDDGEECDMEEGCAPDCTWIAAR